MKMVISFLPSHNHKDLRSTLWEVPPMRTLEKGMATCSSILAWEIPWTEEPGGPQSMGVAKSLA